MYEIEMSKYKISRDLVYVMIWGERLLFFDLLTLVELWNWPPVFNFFSLTLLGDTY